MTGDELLELEDGLDRCAQIAVDAKYNRESAALTKSNMNTQNQRY